MTSKTYYRTTHRWHQLKRPERITPLVRILEMQCGTLLVREYAEATTTKPQDICRRCEPKPKQP